MSIEFLEAYYRSYLRDICVILL